MAGDDGTDSEDTASHRLEDTSHVSVVTVGEERESVKDSASLEDLDNQTPIVLRNKRLSKQDSGKLQDHELL